MTTGTAALLRRCIGWCGAALFGVILILLVDGLVGSFKQAPNTLTLLPGATSVVSGPLPPDIKELTELQVTSDPAGPTISMEKTYTGFWLGGSNWRGLLSIPAKSSPGDYTLTVRGKNDSKIPPQNIFSVRIFSNFDALRAASPTYSMKLFGVQPFTLAASLAPAVLLVVACTFLFSKLLEQLMAREGKAEIYMLKRSPQGFMISFGLGADHGLKMGDQVDILNAQNLRIGAAEVVQCAEKDSVALVCKEADHIEVGHVVAIIEALEPRATA